VSFTSATTQLSRFAAVSRSVLLRLSLRRLRLSESPRAAVHRIQAAASAADSTIAVLRVCIIHTPFHRKPETGSTRGSSPGRLSRLVIRTVETYSKSPSFSMISL
jgi:hypothetical protein